MNKKVATIIIGSQKIPQYIHQACVSILCFGKVSLIARFMGPTWGTSGADRTQVGPMLAPWTLLSGMLFLEIELPTKNFINIFSRCI